MYLDTQSNCRCGYQEKLALQGHFFLHVSLCSCAQDNHYVFDKKLLEDCPNLYTSNFYHEHGCPKNMTSMVTPELNPINFFFLKEQKKEKMKKYYFGYHELQLCNDEAVD